MITKTFLNRNWKRGKQKRENTSLCEAFAGGWLSKASGDRSLAKLPVVQVYDREEIVYSFPPVHFLYLVLLLLLIHTSLYNFAFPHSMVS